MQGLKRSSGSKGVGEGKLAGLILSSVTSKTQRWKKVCDEIERMREESISSFISYSSSCISERLDYEFHLLFLSKTKSSTLLSFYLPSFFSPL